MTHKTKIVTGILTGLLIIAAIATTVWVIQNRSAKNSSQQQQIEQSATDPSSAQPNYSYGRIDRCCFEGWAYDNNQPVTVQITLENIDHPGIKRTFAAQSEDPQSQFLFQTRGDVNDYLATQGITSVTAKTGFQSSFNEQLYPGRYRMSATYNGKAFDTAMLGTPVFVARWFGLYERRYNPVGHEFIEHRDPFDVIENPTNGKVYPIKPRADLLSTENARWSPDGKNIAYNYSTTPIDGYSAMIFNVLTPGEVYSGKYNNPARALIGGDYIQHSWLDVHRIVAVSFIEKQTDQYNNTYYKRAIIEVYNNTRDTFEYPMTDYIENVYSVDISPDGKRYQFSIKDGDGRAYIITDIHGKQLRTIDAYQDDWYTY